MKRRGGASSNRDAPSAAAAAGRAVFHGCDPHPYPVPAGGVNAARRASAVDRECKRHSFTAAAAGVSLTASRPTPARLDDEGRDPL